MNTAYEFPETMFMRNLKVSELFDYVEHDDPEFENFEDGEYPVITNRLHNNGISRFIESFDFDEPLISVNSLPPALGMCRVQTGKYSVMKNVHLLRLKNKYEQLKPVLINLCACMNITFHVRWAKCFKMSKDDLMNELVQQIPFEQDKKNKKKMVISVEGIKYIYNFWSPGDMSKENWYDAGDVGEKVFRIDEVFELVRGLRTFDQNAEPGPYPYISASAEKNGITGYINEYSYDTQGKNVISVAGFGSSGSCFAQNGKFAIRGHGSIMILKLKPKYELIDSSLSMIAYIMKLHFKNQKYSYNAALNNGRLMNETLTLPIVKSTSSLNTNLLNAYTWTHFV